MQVICGLLIAALVLWLASWFASEVFEGETLGFDLSVRNWIHQFASPWLTTVMIWLSVVGTPASLSVIFSVAVITLCILRKWRDMALLIIVMAGEVMLDLGLKGHYERVRPEPFFGYVLPRTSSFPSGHSLGSFCLFAAMAWIIGSQRPAAARAWAFSAAAVLVLLIGVSRIYLGVHYPTDVLAGYLAGAIWFTAVVLAMRYGGGLIKQSDA